MSETVGEAAARRLEEQEARERAERLKALERDEQARRDVQARELRAAQRREEARQTAAECAALRRPLEERAEAEMGALVRTLRELEALDRKHTAALRETGVGLPARSLRGLLPTWVGVRLGRWSKGASYDPHGGAPLADRDPLTPPE
jgi:hypothetical protein